jgi:hypothetical protein
MWTSAVLPAPTSVPSPAHAVAICSFVTTLSAWTSSSSSRVASRGLSSTGSPWMTARRAARSKWRPDSATSAGAAADDVRARPRIARRRAYSYGKTNGFVM